MPKKSDNGKTGDVDERVVEVLDETGLTDHLIHLSSGVILRAKAAPPLALVKVIGGFPRPKPPVYFNEKMGRDMENPDHPDYIERLKAHQTESSNAVLNALILLGTELVEVPKRFPKPEDNDWLEEYQELGLPSKPENKKWRYLNWVFFKAVLNNEDLVAIRDEVGRLSGVSEESVQSAEAFSGRGAKP